MKIISFCLFIMLQAWVLTACAANASNAQTAQTITLQGTEYTLLSNVKLVKDPNWQGVPTQKIILSDDEQTVQLQAHSSTNKKEKESSVIARFGNMNLIPNDGTTAQQTQSTSTTSINQKSFFIQNNTTGKVSIVNGEIIVLINDGNKETARAIANDFNITFVTFVARKNKALYQTSIGDTLFTTVQAMEGDSRMSQVTLRLIDNLPVAH